MIIYNPPKNEKSKKYKAYMQNWLSNESLKIHVLTDFKIRMRDFYDNLAEKYTTPYYIENDTRTEYEKALNWYRKHTFYYRSMLYYTFEDAKWGVVAAYLGYYKNYQYTRKIYMKLRTFSIEQQENYTDDILKNIANSP